MGLRELIMLVGSVAIPICPPPKPRGSHVQEECVSKIDCPDDSCGLQKTCKLPGLADVHVACAARASGMLRLLPDCMEGTELPMFRPIESAEGFSSTPSS